MKSKNLLISSGILVVVAVIFVLSVISGNSERKYNPKKSQIYQEFAGAAKWLASIKNDPLTGELNIIDVLNAQKEIAQLTNSKAIGLQWDELGPNNVGGRTRAILVDKDNSNVLYAGGVAGGLFKTETGGTSWIPLPGLPDVNICCIAQSPITGYLYVGTGEYFANVDGISGTPGFLGSGLYESTDGGNSWAIFNGAKPTSTNNTGLDWSFVNDIVVDPVSGRIYAGTYKGLRYWDTNSSQWVNPVYAPNGTTILTGVCTALAIGSDQTIAAVVGNKVYISSEGSNSGNPHTFVDRTPPEIGTSRRIEIDIAPSNPNYIYAVVANAIGSLKGVYRSIDKGQNWEQIAPGGSPAFNLFGDNSQGTYDNVVTVHPTNPDKIFMGGIVVWEWHYGGNVTQVTIGSEQYDCHVDMHAIVFDKRNPNIFYLGSDGGIAKTTDGGYTFQHINRNYSITQFYALAHNGTTGIMGGTQDNSNPYVSGTGFDTKKGMVLYSGDGGWAAFSLINPDAFFGTSQYAGIWRSPDRGATYQQASNLQFMSTFMIGSYVPGENAGPFITPMLHWESFNNSYSPDYTWYVDTLKHVIGDNIVVKSQNDFYPFNYIITPEDFYYSNVTDTLFPGDTLYVKDIITSHFFVGTANGVWMTKKALHFGITPQWFNIANIANPHTFTISKCGNYLFVGTVGGKLYRISNILAITDSLSATYNSPYSVLEFREIESFAQAVTSIAVDPNNPNRVLATLGNYGRTKYIYYSSNALDYDPTFEAKQGTTAGKKLPAMPVYSCIFEMSNPKMVIIGTEYGMYATQDITKSEALIEWTEENNGMPRVPVFMIRQQVYNYPGVTNYGAIYVATHGRGFYGNFEYLGINNNNKPSVASAGKLNIYPNPATDYINIGFSLNVNSGLTINIYDLKGKLVKTQNIYNKPSGYHTEKLNCSELSKGSYIIQLVHGNEYKSGKFLIVR